MGKREHDGDRIAEAHGAARDVDAAIRSRYSARAFLDRPVSRETVRHLLELARHAPSGTNTQPWLVYVVAGEVRERLCAAVLEAYWADPDRRAREYRTYPDPWFEPYLGRRRSCGWGLYGALGIERGEKPRMRAQRARNYEFFGAPVGLLFTIDRRLQTGSWLDLGMFIQSIMIAARGQDLHTCPQAAFADYHDVIRAHLPVPDEQIVVCGMALGYADPDPPENRWRTEREPVDSFTTWCGLD